jgi:hypothetical protein
LGLHFGVCRVGGFNEIRFLERPVILNIWDHGFGSECAGRKWYQNIIGGYGGVGEFLMDKGCVRFKVCFRSPLDEKEHSQYFQKSKI